MAKTVTIHALSTEEKIERFKSYQPMLKQLASDYMDLLQFNSRMAVEDVRKEVRESLEWLKS